MNTQQHVCPIPSPLCQILCNYALRRVCLAKCSVVRKILLLLVTDCGQTQQSSMMFPDPLCAGCIAGVAMNLSKFSSYLKSSSVHFAGEALRLGAHPVLIRCSSGAPLIAPESQEYTPIFVDLDTRYSNIRQLQASRLHLSLAPLTLFDSFEAHLHLG